jgi:DNA-binding transcriptional LysR family regulator
VSYFTVRGRPSMAWSARHASLKVDPMQMHQIRYFLALCAERNFTRAARRSGVSQPSLTNAISALERELGGALFQRKPAVALTALGHTVQPYLHRIAQEADQAREAAQALVEVRPTNGEAVTIDQVAGGELCSSS